MWEASRGVCAFGCWGSLPHREGHGWRRSREELPRVQGPMSWGRGEGGGSHFIWTEEWQCFRKLAHNHKGRMCLKSNTSETSLVVQWLRLGLLMQGAWVQSLVGELRSYMPYSQKNIREKEYCNKFNKDLWKMVHIQKNFKKSYVSEKNQAKPKSGENWIMVISCKFPHKPHLHSPGTVQFMS